MNLWLQVSQDLREQQQPGKLPENPSVVIRLDYSPRIFQSLYHHWKTVQIDTPATDMGHQSAHKATIITTTLIVHHSDICEVHRTNP